MKHNHLATWISLSLLATVASGCADDLGSDVDLATDSSPILAGEDLPSATVGASGIVGISSGCSGTLLNEYWVLSAAHCFPSSDANNDGAVDNPSTYSVGFGNVDTPHLEIAATKIIKHPSSSGLGSTGGVDAALIKLASAAPVANRPSWWKFGRASIYPGTGAGMLNAEVTMAGYGCNVSDLVSPPGDGYWYLRRSRMRVSSADSTRISVNSREGQGLTCAGDSGGPSFLDDFGPSRTRYLLGIHSTSSRSPNGSSTDVVSQAFRDWVETNAFGSAPKVSWSCLGSTCKTKPAPLPNSVKQTLAYAPYGAAQRECYDATATYDFELNKDYVTVAGTRLTGKGTKTVRVCGVLPILIETSSTVQSAGLTMTAANRSTAYECTIDIDPAATTCSGKVVVTQSGGMARVNFDMSGQRRLYVSAEICKPNNWIMNIGDSSCNDGGSGDCASFSNDAELDVLGTGLRVFGRQGMTDPLLYQDPAFLDPDSCTWRNFQISDGVLDVPDINLTINSSNLLRLNQPDTEGSPDYKWYMGLNRVISDSRAVPGDRVGSGVRRALIRLE